MINVLIVHTQASATTFQCIAVSEMIRMVKTCIRNQYREECFRSLPILQIHIYNTESKMTTEYTEQGFLNQYGSVS